MTTTPDVKRRRPPYGRRLTEILAAPTAWLEYAGTAADGTALTVWVAIGSGAWSWARDRERSHLVLVCPDDPAGYDWSACVGHDPVLIHRAGDVPPARVHALAAALLRDGVSRALDTATGDLHKRQEVAPA